MNKLALAACVVTLLSVAPALSQNAPPGNPTNTGFMAQQPGDRLASRLVGLNIQNTGNENIGEIYDIILTDAGAVKAYIVSVGGFLGMGTRYVAIDPKAIGFPFRLRFGFGSTVEKINAAAQRGQDGFDCLAAAEVRDLTRRETFVIGSSPPL